MDATAGTAVREHESEAVERVPRASGWARRRRTGTVVVSVVLLAVHVAGGWHFAGVLHDEALDAEARRADIVWNFDVDVLAIGDGSIELADTDHRVRLDGVWGVAWRGGYGLISGPPVIGDGSVTRTFEPLAGEPLDVGARVDVHERAFPDDPAPVLGAEPEVVVIDGPLGAVESWFFPGERSVWVLLMHGNGLDRLDLAKLLPAIRDAGFPVLLVPLRNAPDAPEDPSGMLRYGDTEWADLEAAVVHALDTGAEAVIPVAPSMGGGVALTFLERSASAASVSGVVLDSPLVDFGRAVDAQADDEGLPLVGLPIPGTLVATAKRFADWRFGVDWDATGHLDETDRLEVPILVFHGTDDADVPIATSRELAAARPDLVTLVEVDDAPHLASWNLDPEAYERVLISFLDRVGG